MRPTEGGADGARDASRSDAIVDAAPADAAMPDAAPPGPPRSCAEVLARDPGAADGPQIVDPDGEGPAAPVAVYCDMSADGGGWTLCGVAVNNTTYAVHELLTTQSANWFGCDLLLPEGTDRFAELRVLTESSAGSYRDLFRDAAFDATTLSTTGEAGLVLHRESAACSRPSAGNFQWALRSDTTLRFGIDRLRFACSGSGMPSWFVYAKGVTSDGCAGVTQIPPYVGFPCGSYGDKGVRMTLWYRPADGGAASGL